MNMQSLKKKSIFLLVKKIFEMYPTQNEWRYLSQRDQKTAGGI